MSDSTSNPVNFPHNSTEDRPQSSRQGALDFSPVGNGAPVLSLNIR
jgi:hypothetical protein